MVFQSYALYPHKTVAENMVFALRLQKQPADVIKQRLQAAAETLDLVPYLDRYPRQLSGGQRQRVAMGRAIVRSPQVFLFDEPLSNLDAELRVQMRVEISRLHKQLGTTMIYVTHDQTEAMTLADRIVVLRAGNIEQIGAPLDLYDDPANQFVAGFVGSPKMNFLKAVVVEAQPGRAVIALESDANTRLTLPVADPIEADAKVTLGIRPEHFVDAGAGDADLTVTIDVAEHLGNTSYIYATIGPEQLIIERPESRVAGNRETLTVGLPASRTFLFDGAGKRLR
jgi:lactose/L-arabinose transport system ATP-binding protein